MTFIAIAFIFACILLLILDAARAVNLMSLPLSCVWITAAPHYFILVYLLIKYVFSCDIPAFLSVLSVAAAILLLAYITLRLHISPIRKYKTKKKTLRIMLCGRRLVQLSIFGGIVQIPLCIFLYKGFLENGGESWVWITDLVLTIAAVFFYVTNGILRIFATSKRYGALKKLVIFMLLFVPLINIFVLLRYCRDVKHEYDHEAYMVEALSQTAESEICSTKYPIVLVHGVGFRDFKYINYWGRIPRELTRQGAQLFYGHQQAWTTIAESAENIRETIL